MGPDGRSIVPTDVNASRDARSARLQRVSRRAFLRSAVLTSGVLLLTACAPAQPAAPAKPTEAPKPAETKPAESKPVAPAAAPATAPAAASKPAGTKPVETKPAETKPAAAPASADGGRLVIAYDAEPAGLDPNLATTADFRQVTSFIFDTLVQLDLTSDNPVPPLQPGLAESWSLSADGKTHTFKLRKGVKFSDGTEFDANAVKAMFERLSDKSSKRHSEKAASLNARYGFTWVTGTRVVDPSTIEVELNQINPEFPRLMALQSAAIVSPAALDKWSEAEIVEHPVGTGPFTLTSWTRGQELLLARNPNYWGEAPKLSQLVIRPIPDANTRATALLTGEVQFVHNVPPGPLTDRLGRDPNVKILSTGGANVVFWTLNSKAGPTKDKRVRQALNYAINREAIVKQLSGLAMPAKGLLSPGNPAYTDDLKGYAFDPAKAKSLLAEAGFASGFSFKMNVPAGNGGWPPEGMEAWQIVQANLRDVGVQVDLSTLDGSAYSTFITPGLADDAPAGVTWSITGAELISLPESLMGTAAQPPRGTNRGWYSNAEVDEVTKQAGQERDFDKRVALYRKADALLVEDASCIFLYYKRVARGVRASVKGVYAPASAFYTLNHASVS